MAGEVGASASSCDRTTVRQRVPAEHAKSPALYQADRTAGGTALVVAAAFLPGMIAISLTCIDRAHIVTEAVSHQMPLLGMFNRVHSYVNYRGRLSVKVLDNCDAVVITFLSPA
ncbi:hypothetical protein F5Y03DRAFT_397168 [Xylaria venustula]|nr:hypothetical protein F5Y03DRAFT_397168 [Xylaria venustula]